MEHESSAILVLHEVTQAITKMSQFNKSKDVEIGSIVLDGANVPTYKAKERDLRLHAKAWLPETGKNPDHHYFEIQVLSMGTSIKISLGVRDSAKCSFEYRADGKIYYDGKMLKSNKEVRFDHKNAIVGCGIDFIEQSLFFVLPDGSKMFYPTSKGSNLKGVNSLIPFVTLNDIGENIAVNFGERNFMHDPFNEKVTGPSFFAQNRSVECSIEEDQTMTISNQDKSNYRSLQANRLFDRTNPTAFPYFELQVIKADAHVMMGFSDVLLQFDMNTAIGKMPNSCGWTDARQSYDHSTNHSGLLIQTFGDIFGCGITMDSYNSHRMFITKNGKWIGFVGSGEVPPCMDCFPTISILGSANVSYNFGATKFSWDFKNMPLFPHTSSIDAMPTELLQHIFEYVGHSGSFTALIIIGAVNKKWRKIVLEMDPLWRRMYYEQFPNQTPDLKVKSWYKFYKRRAQAMKTVNDPHPIENCTLAFECPMILENFKDVKEGDTKVFCDKCQKDVHIVETIGELNNHASLGHCVAWKEQLSEDEDWMGGSVFYDDSGYPDDF